MKSEFALAFNEITERFGLSQDTVMEALKAAMVSAYRRSVNASTAQEIEARVESETGEVRIFSEKEIVDEVLNPLTEVTLEEALQFDDQAEMAGMSLVDSTPEDFGRVAAQTAKQVILQRLREAERDAQYEEYIEREGDMVHGTVHSITPQSVTVGLGRAEAILPRNQQIPGERFHVRDRIRVYVLEVRKSSRGPVIVVSRTHPNMLRRLLEMEVPEINQGLVEIMAIAREAGKRAKVAVAATRDGVDPVGACVGMRGVRIQSIVRDLNDEKIDVIEWNSDAATFISKALSPARVSGVFLDENLDRGKTAMVVVPEDQLSLAIGRAGVNARLSARLTNWRIDIKSLVEAATESLNRLATDKAFAEIAAAEAETMPQIEMILIKKQETRPVTPEEYHLLTDFVVRVEEELMARRNADRQVYLEKLEKIREGVPPGAYQVTLVEAGISTRVANLLTEGEYESAGKVLEQLEIDEDKILALQGVGPKAISELRQTLSAYDYPDPAVEEVAEEAEEEPAAEAEGIEEQPAAEAEATEGEQPALEVEGEPAVQETEGEVTGEAIPIEEAFQRAIEEVGQIVVESDESEKSEAERKAARKKRKQLSRVVEYDPDLGETVSRRVRKESRRTDWQETGEFEE